MSSHADAILGFLRANIDPEIELDTQLVEEGFLDSFQALNVISFLEEEFGLRIDSADLTDADLASARNLAELVARLSGAGDSRVR